MARLNKKAEMGTIVVILLAFAILSSGYFIAKESGITGFAVLNESFELGVQIEPENVQVEDVIITEEAAIVEENSKSESGIGIFESEGGEVGVQANINACGLGSTIVSPGTYNVTADILNSGENICIVVATGSVILDCGGHILDGTDGNQIGIQIGTVSGVTVRNCIINDWKNGIESNAANVVIENNVITSNTQYGIYYFSGATNNKAYNNFLNNTNNAAPNSYFNKWNTTLQAGTNIAGGNYFGGNYWAKPTGTGHSEICNVTHLGGICDEPYTMNANNTDYLPLTTNQVLQIINLSLDKKILTESVHIDDLVQFMINITNHGNINISYVLGDDYNISYLNFTHTNLPPIHANETEGVIDWELNLTTEETKIIILNFTAIHSGNTTNYAFIDNGTAEIASDSVDVEIIEADACIDNDGDGYNQTGEGCGTPDCNDANPNEYPGQTWYPDCDGDTFESTSSQIGCNLSEISNQTPCLDHNVPDGGWSSTLGTDCNDENITEFPGQVWYADCDGDTYERAMAVMACNNPSTPCSDAQSPNGGWQHVAGNDCDDEDNTSYFGASEICNDGHDNDCDSYIDCQDSDCGGSESCALPNTTAFNSTYGSTNFSAVPNIQNVTNLTLANAYGKINFPANYGVNASGENYNLYVRIGGGFVSVNTSALDSSFNASANVTITGVSCPATVYYSSGFPQSVQEVILNGGVCNSGTNPSCTNIQCSFGTLTFTVSHFTGYAYALTANLTIWDETDTGMHYAGMTKYPNEQIRFFANYSNVTTELDGASCLINFSSGSYPMVWNSTVRLYEYNRSFGSAGTYLWNVTCNKTGYDMLTAEDNVTVSDNSAPAVMLVTPINGSIYLTSDVLFNITATNDALRNATLYTDILGYWAANSTNLISGTINSTTWVINPSNYWPTNILKDTKYSWNAYVCDDSGNCGWSINNATFSGWDLGIYNNARLNETGIHLGGDNEQELPSISEGYVNTSGMVGLWHLNNNTIDFSGKGNNGTIGGGLSDTTGKLNGAYLFDGIDDKIDLGRNLSIINNISGATLMAWIKPKKQPLGGDIIGISINNASKELEAVSRAEMYIPPGLPLVVRARAADTDVGLVTQTLVEVQLDTWQHVVGIINYETGQIQIYINGQNQSTSTVGSISQTRTSAKSSNVVAIGSNEDLASGSFNGTIDEVAIWNRTLTAKEVMDIYNRQKGEYIDRADYESRIFNLGKISVWKNLTWDENLNPNTKINISARSCDDSLCAGETYGLTCNDSSYCNLSALADNQYFQYKVDLWTNNTNYTPELLTNSVVVSYEETDITPPVVHLVSPANNTQTVQSVQEFECNITNNEVESISLNVWDSANRDVLGMQGPEWNVTFGGANVYYGRAIAVDDLGNVYVTGTNYSFGATSSDILTVKYDSNGNKLWDEQVIGPSLDDGYGIATDSSGNVYIAGDKGSPDGSSDYWTVKYDTNGNYQWNKTANRTGADTAYGIATDSSGNVYVTGESFTSTANFDFWTIKYDTNGNHVWNRTRGTSNTESGYGITTDSSGNVYVTGYAWSASTIGDVWTVKYDSNGNYLWNRTIGGLDSDIGQGIIVDASGGVYVIGYTRSFGANPYSTNDFWIIKYDSNGNYLWNRTAGGTQNDYGKGIALDGQGNIYVSGYTLSFGPANENYWILKYDSNGNQIWNKTAGSIGKDYGQGVAVDYLNNVYVTGYSNSSVPGNYSYWTIKYDSYLEDVSGISNSSSWNVTLPSEGIYKWNCLGIDSAQNSAWSEEGNYTLTYNVTDVTSPTVNLLSPTNNTITVSASQNFSCSITDAGGVSYLNFHLWNSSNSDIIDTLPPAVSLSIGGSNDDRGEDVAVDSQKNVYVVAETKSFAINANYDMWILKYYANGSQAWNRTRGTTNLDVANAVSLDDNSNLYIAGSFTGDFALISYDRNGNYLWNWSYNSLVSAAAQAVVFYNNQGIYVAGHDEAAAGDDDIIVAKLNSSGAHLWNKTIGGNGEEQAAGIDTDSAGNVYIAGYTNSTGGQYYKAWLIKLNSSGDIQWNKTYGGVSSYDYARDVVVDSNDNVYVAVYPNIIKYNSSGDYQWNSSYSNLALALGVDSFDNVYAAGDYLNTYTWVTKFNSSGKQLWNRTTLKGAFSRAYGIAIDSSSNIYTAGYTSLDAYNLHLVKFQGFVEPVSGVSNSTYWNVTLPYSGTYKWNCLGIDTSNNTAWAVANYTLYSDFTAPTISNQKNYTNNGFDWTFQAQSNENANCTLFGNWSGSWVANETKNVSANTAFNFTSILFTGEDILYKWNVNCTDNLGNNRWGTNYSFIVGALDDSIIINSTIINTNYSHSNITDSNITDSIVNNSVILNSTIDDSTIIDSFINDSVINLSVILNSTIDDSYVWNSTIEDSFVYDSNITDSTINLSVIINSTIDNSDIYNSTIEDSTVIDSTITDSTINLSTILNSTVDNSDVYNSTIEDSTVIDSTITDSTINLSTILNSTIDNSDIWNSTIEDSTVIDSTITDSTINLSIILNSTIDNSDIYNSTIDSSTIIDSTITDSTVNMSTIINSTIDNSDVFNSTVEDSTIESSDITNSDINLSTIIDSNVSDAEIIGSFINNSDISDSTIINANITDSTLENTTVINSTIDGLFLNNFTINNCTIIDSNLSNGFCDDSTIIDTIGDGWEIDPSTVVGSICLAAPCRITNSEVYYSNLSVSTIDTSKVNYTFANNSLANISVLKYSYYRNMTVLDSNDSQSIQISGYTYIDPSDLFNNTYYDVNNISNSTVWHSILDDAVIINSNVTLGIINESWIINSIVNNCSLFRQNLTDQLCLNGFVQSAGNLSCVVASGGCTGAYASYTDVLHISNTTNAHAELPNGTDYDYSICCIDLSGTYNITNSTGYNFIDLSDATNAHVELPNEPYYGFDAYIGAVGRTVSCSYPESNGVCPSNQTCLATISANATVRTNLHIADCITQPYATSICCGITNNPVVQDIYISSDAPNGMTGADYGNLTGHFNYSDADGDPQVANETAWFNNSLEVILLRNLTWIHSGNLTQGERWIFSARVYDGVGWSEWENSSEFVINTRPNATSVVTSDDLLNRTNGNLFGTTGIVDVDNDVISANETKWYNNSIEVASLANLQYVAAGNTTRGEIWTFSTRVWDGSYWSNWINSTITINNAAPSLTGLNITPLFGDLGTSVTVISAIASDIDLDNLNLTCGNETGNYNLCSSTLLKQPEVNCTFNSQWADSTTHTVFCIATDNGLNSTEQTITFTSDNSGPVWSNNKTYPASGIAYIPGANYQFNITWTDTPAGVANVTIEHNFTGTLINYSMSNLTSEYYYNFNNLAVGTYVWRSYANDSIGNYGVSDQWIYHVSSNTSVCTLDIVPGSPQAYGVLVNASCSCTNPEANPRLYRNGTDVTLTENSINTTLGAGYHYYVCNVTSSMNYTNATTSQLYIISPANHTLHLAFNGTEADSSFEYLSIINATGWLEIVQEIASAILYRNGTNVATGSPATNLSVLGVGIYNYTYYYPGSQNYTAQSLTRFVQINQTTPVCTLNFNPASSSIYGTQLNVTCLCTNTETSPKMYRDGEDVTGENGINVTLAARSYNYTCNITETYNYTNTSTTSTYTVNRSAHTIHLAINGAEADGSLVFPAITNATGWLEIIQGAINAILYRNGTNVATGSPATNLSVLGVGAYNYTYYYPQSENYTAQSLTRFLQINQTTPACTLTFTPAPPTPYGTPLNASCVCTNPETAAMLYRNGSNVTATNNQFATLGAGDYYYNCTTAATQNYTFVNDTDLYTVTQAVGLVYLYLNSSRANMTAENNSFVNISGSIAVGAGSVLVYNNGTPIYNGSSPSQNITQFTSIGLYNITVYAVPTENFTGDDETWWLTVVRDLTMPTVTLVSPASGSSTTATTVGFTCTATDNVNLANITFYNNINGTWAVNGTNITTGTSNQSIFTVEDIALGSYVWNCYACDDSGYCAFAASNSTFTIASPAAPVTGGGGAGGGGPSICGENWNCTEWSSCMPDGMQYRSCYDLNRCDEKYNQRIVTYVNASIRPEESRNCGFVQTCFPNENILGQEILVRGYGAPEIYEYKFGADAGAYLLYAGNNLDASADITLNGIDILRQYEFNVNDPLVFKEVNLGESNKLSVKVNGMPGSSIVLWIAQSCKCYDSECIGGFECDTGRCVLLPSCSDSIINNGETGIDCGGLCEPCVEVPAAMKIPTIIDIIVSFAEEKLGPGVAGGIVSVVNNVNSAMDAVSSGLSLMIGGIKETVSSVFEVIGLFAKEKVAPPLKRAASATGDYILSHVYAILSLILLIAVLIGIGYASRHYEEFAAYKKYEHFREQRAIASAKWKEDRKAEERKRRLYEARRDEEKKKEERLQVLEKARDARIKHLEEERKIEAQKAKERAKRLEEAREARKRQVEEERRLEEKRLTENLKRLEEARIVRQKKLEQRRVEAAKRRELRAKQLEAEKKREQELAEIRANRAAEEKAMHEQMKEEYAKKLDAFLYNAVQRGIGKAQAKQMLARQGWPKKFVDKYCDSYFTANKTAVKQVQKKSLETMEDYYAQKIKENPKYIKEVNKKYAKEVKVVRHAEKPAVGVQPKKTLSSVDIKKQRFLEMMEKSYDEKIKKTPEYLKELPKKYVKKVLLKREALKPKSVPQFRQMQGPSNQRLNVLEQMDKEIEAKLKKYKKVK